jgi:hypothetical protein
MIFILGAIINRIRGGWATDIAWARGWLAKPNEVPHVKFLNDLIWSIVFGILVQTTHLGCLVLFFTKWVGRSWGWGGYMHAMINEEINHNDDDVKLLDKWFRGNDEAVLSGWAALSCRGLMWSVCIYFGLLVTSLYGNEPSIPNPLIAALGLAMGSIYLLAMTICGNKFVSDNYYEFTLFLTRFNVMTKAVRLERGNGWQLGEFLFGGYLWGYTAKLIIG